MQYMKTPKKWGDAVRYNVLIINGRNNVGVALWDLDRQEEAMVGGEKRFPLLENIPVSHKVSLRDIETEKEIIKYGEAVGISMQKIRPGAWVHTHNLESQRWKK